MLEYLIQPHRFRAIADRQPAIPLGGPPAPRRVKAAPAAEPGFPVYLVEPERGLRIALTRDLNAAGFEARPFATPDDFEAALPELAPGCVVIDIAAVATDGAAPREQGGKGELRFPTILIFSILEPDEAIAAVRLGAAELMQRPVDVDELVAALRRAAPRVHELALRMAASRAKAAVDTLTPRERQVMECIMLGRSNKEMARIFGLSPRTIEMHRARLHRRLGVASLTELLALAWSARGAGGA
jgi:two-component system, LuxR family, response regulator FixJ